MPRLTTKQRRRKLEQCGRRAFGDPDGPRAKRAGRPRYPLVDRGCDVSCKGSHDAFRRARQRREPGIADRIRAIARAAGCPWASGG